MLTEAVEIQPRDRFNEQLMANAHPSDWRNPTPDGKYNLVVVGAGTAGLVSAAGAAALGAKVALIERNLMGGDCLNVGCVPSKALIRAARAYADVRDAGRFGVNVGGAATVDFASVMERMRRLRARISPNDSVRRFADMGIDVYLGNGTFTGGGTIEVDGRTLKFARAAVTTGARAAAPPIPGLEDAGYLTNETLFSLAELPKRLAIFGAGPIGCEMAQTFARFGSEVYLIEMTGHVLPREPENVSQVVEAAFERDGVNLLRRTRAAKVETNGAAKVVHLEGEDSPATIDVDEILVSIGRAPNVDGLGLESAGVAFDPRKGVEVDEYLRTTNKRIYAAGDICFPYKFTHTADALASILIQNALFFRSRKTSALVIPWCTYTDPEVAHVGMYPADARERGMEVDTYTAGLDDVDRAILDGEENGFIEVYTKRGTDRILGATIVARHAGEMIGEVTMAVGSKLGLGTLSSMIHPYPTQAEVIRKAAKEYYKTRLTPTVAKWMARWMKWRR